MNLKEENIKLEENFDIEISLQKPKTWVKVKNKKTRYLCPTYPDPREPKHGP